MTDKEERLRLAREKAKVLNLPPQVTENVARTLVALGCEHIDLDEAGLERVLGTAIQKGPPK